MERDQRWMLRLLLPVWLFGSLCCEGYPMARQSFKIPEHAPGAWTAGANADYGVNGADLLVPKDGGRLEMSEGEARSSFWHPEVSNFNEASIVVQLQINGDLENTDNSSIAFWLEQKVPDQPDFLPGPLSGHSADFLGLGVVFSKFQGSESDPEHKELSLVVSRTKGDTDLPEGCKVRAAHGAIEELRP